MCMNAFTLGIICCFFFKLGMHTDFVGFFFSLFGSQPEIQFRLERKFLRKATKSNEQHLIAFLADAKAIYNAMPLTV